jgi:hypothetical protein
MRIVLSLIGGMLNGIACAEGIVEAEKHLPLVQDVDVVRCRRLVRRGRGGVQRRPKRGEGFLLAAPRPIPGEDLAGKLHLEPDVEAANRVSLLRRIFHSANASPDSLPFLLHGGQRQRHSAQGSDGQMLTDGRWRNPRAQSVQFDGDVDFVLDLGAPIKWKSLLRFSLTQRRQGFQNRCHPGVGGADGTTWQPLGETEARKPRTSSSSDVSPWRYPWRENTVI